MQLRSLTSRIVSTRGQKDHRLALRKRIKESSHAPHEVPSLDRELRILIVDRDTMSSALLAGALACSGRREAIAIQPSDLLQDLAESPADLVVIASELTSGCRNGFDLAQAVGRAYPKIAVVMLLNQSSSDAVVGAFRCGARGVFSREQPVAALLDCVERVSEGFLWAGKQESDFLLGAFRSVPAPSLLIESNAPSLTARELQVVQCAAKGRTNRAIGNELGLSEHTVKNYMFRAFEKLGVSSRVELLFYLTLRGHSMSETESEAEALAPAKG